MSKDVEIWSPRDISKDLLYHSTSLVSIHISSSIFFWDNFQLFKTITLFPHILLSIALQHYMADDNTRTEETRTDQGVKCFSLSLQICAFVGKIPVLWSSTTWYWLSFIVKQFCQSVNEWFHKTISCKRNKKNPKTNQTKQKQIKNNTHQNNIIEPKN